MTDIQQIETEREQLEVALRKLIAEIGPIQIGSRRQFPAGWRKAAKGRTVWRIVEEAVNQNLECHHIDLGLATIMPSESEVSIFDTAVQITEGISPIYINLKTAVEGGRVSKDDISKAVGLRDFLDEDILRHVFIATFVIEFSDDMTVTLKQCHVMPVPWIPDIYVNPSNNGNLQSSKYKDMSQCTRRTNSDFLALLKAEMEIARAKREKKMKR